MLLLEILSFDPALLYSILACLVILIGGLGFFFNLKNNHAILKTDLENTKANLQKLEIKLDATYSKIENKISELEKKITDLPHEIISLLKSLKE